MNLRRKLEHARQKEFCKEGTVNMRDKAKNRFIEIVLGKNAMEQVGHIPTGWEAFATLRFRS